MNLTKGVQAVRCCIWANGEAEVAVRVKAAVTISCCISES